MAVAGSQTPRSADRAGLHARAEALGWSVEDPPPGTRRPLRCERSDLTVESFFSTDGEFRAARIHGPTGPDEELDFPSTLDFLQRHGTDAGQGGTAAAEAAAVLARSAARRSPAGPAPQETPPAEESTTAGISTPEPPEVRQAWGTWPIVVVAVLVVCVVLFFVARIAGW